jgi:hypothetical protein
MSSHPAEPGERPHHTEEAISVTDPKNGTKTLGIKLPPGLHAQFALVAQLDNISLNVAVLRAVEQYVANKQSEPDFAKRAADALAEIEAEAAARKAAIEGLFGETPVPTTEQAEDDPSKAKTTRNRRSSTQE